MTSLPGKGGGAEIDSLANQIADVFSIHLSKTELEIAGESLARRAASAHARGDTLAAESFAIVRDTLAYIAKHER